MKFTEDTRVKIPVILHLIRLGYHYLSLKEQRWDKETNILFASQKVHGEESSQDMGTNPVVQKWWDYMADIMETNPDNSPVSIPLQEVFRME